MTLNNGLVSHVAVHHTIYDEKYKNVSQVPNPSYTCYKHVSNHIDCPELMTNIKFNVPVMQQP